MFLLCAHNSTELPGDWRYVSDHETWHFFYVTYELMMDIGIV